MRRTDTVIIGAGHAGLALSWNLAALGHDHVVLERGRTAQRWQDERWDSLRLLTPNWMSRLPGCDYDGPEPEGYMTAADLVARLERYARSFAAPVHEHTTVESVARAGSGFVVATDRGTWRATNVVVATGWCDRARVPAAATGVPDAVLQVTSSGYRRPGQLPDGPVLVVGASASGVQIAAELRDAGRDVVLAVGRHARVPRRHRGLDICWWLEAMGDLDRGLPSPDHPRATEPSLQLSGRPDGRSVDLHALRAAGVQLAGRLHAVDGGVARFGDDLATSMAASDARLEALRRRMDEFAASARLDLPEESPLPPTATLARRESLDLRHGAVAAVVWATGFRRAYPWLRLPVLDAHGDIRHRHGITDVPGLYVMGMRFQSRRRSTFVDGARFDAATVTAHLVTNRGVTNRARARAHAA
jgi:putative flavoprotein involved in K+ transport